MKYRSIDGCYLKGSTMNEDGISVPVAYSAFQRKEILEGESYIKDGVEHMRWKVIGHWDDYKKALAEVEKFNRKQDESSGSR